jgi:hypothetical protein
MMDQPDSEDQPAPPAADTPDAPPGAAEPRVAATPPSRRGVGRRIAGAVVLLPWILGYGSVGAWAVTFGARNVAAGNASVDAGYTRLVTPGGVILVGALLLAAFATLLGASLLLLYGSRRRAPWAAVGMAAGLLTAGAVWAGVRGELSPVLWALFFFGLVFALVLAVAQVLRASRRDEVLRP